MNINDNIKIKLTPYGIHILRKQHNELRQKIMNRSGRDIGPFILKIDADGYYEEQLWTIMNTFGPYLIMGKPKPFETEIKV